MKRYTHPRLMTLCISLTTPTHPRNSARWSWTSSRLSTVTSEGRWHSTSSGGTQRLAKLTVFNMPSPSSSWKLRCRYSLNAQCALSFGTKCCCLAANRAISDPSVFLLLVYAWLPSHDDIIYVINSNYSDGMDKVRSICHLNCRNLSF